jgi:hypothetical protein
MRSFGLSGLLKALRSSAVSLLFQSSGACACAGVTGAKDVLASKANEASKNQLP